MATPRGRAEPSQGPLDETDVEIQKDLVRLIAQYLDDEGYSATKTVLQDETNVKGAARQKQHQLFRKLRSSLLDGLWDDVTSLCKQVLKGGDTNASEGSQGAWRAFIFGVYKQQYLEHLDRGETQQGFNHLQKRIKPFEASISPAAMRDLCYVLTCRSVQDCAAFSGWELIAGRQRLVEQLESLFSFSEAAEGSRLEHIPPRRLMELLKQSCAYQIGRTRQHPNITPRVTTLLSDYCAAVIPNCLRSVLRGHTSTVKCVAFVGSNNAQIVSGSSDCTVRLWNTETGQTEAMLEGHGARVWDVTGSASGDVVCSASADATVKLWSVESKECLETIEGHDGDVYSVQIHPSDTHVIGGGYDQSVRLFDLTTKAEVRQFVGHSLGVSQVGFNCHGNLVVSGSKDETIKLWDVTSGLCIKTIEAEMGEVTSVEFNRAGDQLLACTRSNTNALFDLRMNRVVKCYRGHQNTSRHFVRASFGSSSLFISGGSEDGSVYIWDTKTGEVLETLEGHGAAVYHTAWSPHRSILLSCSDDETIRVWHYSG